MSKRRCRGEILVPCSVKKEKVAISHLSKSLRDTLLAWIWYSRRDLNLRLLPSEGSTLSTELRERMVHFSFFYCLGSIRIVLIRMGSSGLSPSLGWTPEMVRTLFIPSITFPKIVYF